MREAPLLWAVEVLASGGWIVLARFANEADAWEYGAKHFDARVYYEGEFRGERRYPRGWSGTRSEGG